MLHHGIKVPIRVQQRVTVPNAIRADQDIDRLAHPDPTLAKPAIVVGGKEGTFAADQVDAGEFQQEFTGGSVVCVPGKSLQELCEDEIAREKAPGSEQLIKLISLRCVDAVEVVHPDGCIDKHHFRSIEPHGIQLA